MVNPKILYEDEDLMVIDKPAGMVVNRSQTSGSETVQDWVEEKLGKRLKGLGERSESDPEHIFQSRSGVAHRLDKETSGCLIIAKKPEALLELMRQFKERETEKEYLALVHGHLEPKEGTIKLPIGRDRFERKKRKVEVEGKKAETFWQVEKYYQGYSLVLLKPKTGRTHQIRVHLAYLGHPIVGDSLYLNKKLRSADRLLVSRHLLHAVAIQFKQPTTGQLILVNAEDPKFDKLIKA